MMPKMTYNGVSIVDISHRFSLNFSLKEVTTHYTEIQLFEGDTPESVSMRYYGTQDYWWLVLVVNNIIDPLYDWLMSDDEIYNYCKLLYGDEINAYHHYEDSDFNIYESQNTQENLMPVTNLEWHEHLNEKKRRINIIHSKFLPHIEKKLSEMIKNFKPQFQE